MGATTMDTPQTGLVRAGSRALIASQAQYEVQLQTWQREQVHALCPMVDFGALPEQFVLVPAKVKINPIPDAGEVYFRSDFCKSGEVALSAMGLQKIAQCAGISLDTTRTDPRTIALYWEFKATASWIGVDGARQSRTATLEWDLRDGSERIKSFTPKQVAEARKHGARNAETRAISAVIRQLGVRQKYTVAELEKPFGLVRVVYQPNMSDPVQRAIVTQQALGGAATFYPGAGLLQAADIIDGHLADAPPVAPVTGPLTAPTPPEPPDFDEISTSMQEAPPPERYRIVKAEMQKRDGLEPLYFLTTDAGVTFRTEHGALARLGAEAKKADAWVTIEDERKGEHRWIVEIRRVDATPDVATSTAAAPVLPAGTCFVEAVEEKSGVKKVDGKADRPWKRYTITLSSGEFGTTFSASLGSVAMEARDKRLPVKATLEDNPAYPEQQTLTALVIIDPNQPSLLVSEL